MVSMQGKTVLVTGATNGIGKITALELAKMGAQVVVVGRNRAKTEATVNEIKSASGNQQVGMLLGDLSLMADVRRIASEFKAQYPRLDVLLNNAGAWNRERQETKEGLELTFALNHMSYFLLTDLLLDMLKASAPARIVNVSSEAHRSANTVDFDDLQLKRSYGMGGFAAYGLSKLLNVLFTYELARRLNGTGVTANVLHPGFVATGFGHNNQGFLMGLFGLFQRMAALKPEQGAETNLYLATSPEVDTVTGKYFDKCKAVASSPLSHDEAIQRKLWEVSEQLAGMKATV